MPTLLEVEHAFYRSLIEQDDLAAAGYILADGVDPEIRLNVHRNTVVGTLTSVLRQSFPAVERLVGAAFFESAARIFVEAAPPREACLDEYGAGFADFLKDLPPAASVVYLSDVARLEWAVSRALHAPDVEPIDAESLAVVDIRDYHRIAFVPHPSISLMRMEYPADEIRRSVLARDDEAMAAVDLGDGPVHVLVQRFGTSEDVRRLAEHEWRFLDSLCAGRPLEEAIGRTLDNAPGVDAESLLTEYLASGSFIDFELVDSD